ncbi:hypothetical protein [Sphingomonas sp.]|uniref:hypothetical protein n=1 Tax=Sphingomonas sp. TaxID=28214 RepID=UPI0026376517|nr:hypothetical protein [Sphingomonas sp.]
MNEPLSNAAHVIQLALTFDGYSVAAFIGPRLGASIGASHQGRLLAGLRLGAGRLPARHHRIAGFPAALSSVTHLYE